MAMAKAYDMTDLVGRLKLRGLDVTHNVAKGLLTDIVGWLQESASVPGGNTVIAAVEAPLIALCCPLIQAQIDKIPHSGS